MSASPRARTALRRWRTRLAAAPTGYRSLRDLLSWLGGVAIIVHEVWFADQVQFYSLLVGAALTGLPLVLPTDAGIGTPREDDEPESRPHRVRESGVPGDRDSATLAPPD